MAPTIIHMQDLTVEQIVALHAAIIARDGGDNRIISEPNLHQLVFRANLIADPISRTALALFSLVAYPAFQEGNEKAAVELATWILTGEGYCIPREHAPELARLAEGILTFTVEPEDIGAWIAAHAKKEQ